MIDLLPNHNNVARYELSDDELVARTVEMIQAYEREFGNPNNERFVTYAVSGNSIYSDVARTIERQVFEEAFNENDAVFMDQEYGDYESSSLFFITVDRERGVPMGALRIIHNSDAGLKTINDIDNPAIPPYLTKEQIQQTHGIDNWDECWDVGTVAVLEQFRHTGASTNLYRSMYLEAQRQNIDHLVAIIDEKPLAAMTGFLAIPFKPMCNSEPFNYLEALKSQAVYGYIPDFDPVINERIEQIKKFQDIHPDQTAINALIKVLHKIIRGTQDASMYPGIIR